MDEGQALPPFPMYFVVGGAVQTSKIDDFLVRLSKLKVKNPLGIEDLPYPPIHFPRPSTERNDSKIQRVPFISLSLSLSPPLGFGLTHLDYGVAVELSGV